MAMPAWLSKATTKDNKKPVSSAASNNPRIAAIQKRKAKMVKDGK